MYVCKHPVSHVRAAAIDTGAHRLPMAKTHATFTFAQNARKNPTTRPTATDQANAWLLVRSFRCGARMLLWLSFTSAAAIGIVVIVFFVFLLKSVTCTMAWLSAQVYARHLRLLPHCNIKCH